MMRVIWICLILLISCFANTDNKIKTNEQKLNSINSKQSAINKKLKILGDNINKENDKIKNLDNDIKKLMESITENEKNYAKQEQIFNDSKARLDSLNKELTILQEKLINVILKDMTIAMVLNQSEPLSEESIISEEVLKHLSNAARVSISRLLDEQKKINNDIEIAKNNLESSKKIILSQQQRKLDLEETKSRKQSITKKLKTELNAYNDELKKLDNERSQIQRILVDLNILKKQELQNQEQKRKNLENDTNVPSIAGNSAPIEVRQIGSSYRNVSTAKYSGKKTIAPLKNYTVETKYGPYFDPVYKIRVFNEFVTFGVTQRSAVQSVLDGKIVFAKSTAMLKMVVIIEHTNGIHTIYSYLDEISKDIKVGAKVKKGSTIAYVVDKLNFEVTQKDKHINPFDFIYVK